MHNAVPVLRSLVIISITAPMLNACGSKEMPQAPPPVQYYSERSAQGGPNGQMNGNMNGNVGNPQGNFPNGSSGGPGSDGGQGSVNPGNMPQNGGGGQGGAQGGNPGNNAPQGGAGGPPQGNYQWGGWGGTWGGQGNAPQNGGGTPQGGTATPKALPANVNTIITNNCAAAGCHGTKYNNVAALGGVRNDLIQRLQNGNMPAGNAGFRNTADYNTLLTYLQNPANF